MIKTYSKSKKEYTDHSGFPNFMNCKRDCPNCKNEMVRIPINQSYLPLKHGKILFDMNYMGTEHAVITNIEPEYIWGCTNCSLAISPKKAK